MAVPDPSPDPDLERLNVLAQAARALHGERDVERALDWARRATKALTGLPEVGICLLPRHGSATWSVGDSTMPFAVLGDPRTWPLTRKGLEAGHPILVTDLASAERALPLTAQLARLVPLACVLVAPIQSRDGLAQGVIVAGDTVARDLGDAEVESVVALAAHLGVALDNSALLARMAQVEARGKEVVHALQEAVRPPAPVVPFTELGVHYVAADPDAPTGGDLYDWIGLPDGDLHLVVVDVMGKGVEATKHALSVTHALRLLAVEGCPLEQIVARTDALVTAQNPDLVATLLVARYRPTTGELRLAGAGHPPALVVDGDSVQEVAAPGIPIGWPGAGSHRVVELELRRSATLILYTDGLIEASKDILAGLESLARSAAATASYPATSLARALVHRQLADAARHDDSLALVLRRRSPPAALPTHVLAPFVHQFSPQPAAVPLARHLMRDWLERVPVEEPALDSLLLAVSELCSNAVRHASGAPGSVSVRAWAERDSVVIEVSDDGVSLEWSDPVSDELPDPEAEQGRGLFLVRELTDELAGRVDAGRTVIRIVKRAVIGTSAPAPAAGPPTRAARQAAW